MKLLCNHAVAALAVGAGNDASTTEISPATVNSAKSNSGDKTSPSRTSTGFNAARRPKQRLVTAHRQWLSENVAQS